MVHGGSASRPQSVPFPLTGALLTWSPTHIEAIIQAYCMRMSGPTMIMCKVSENQAHAALCCALKLDQDMSRHRQHARAEALVLRLHRLSGILIGIQRGSYLPGKNFSSDMYGWAGFQARAAYTQGHSLKALAWSPHSGLQCCWRCSAWGTDSNTIFILKISSTGHQQ